MSENRPYSTRSAAIRAARDHCRKILGNSYQAFEGPDFEIHPCNDKFPDSYWRYTGYSGPSFYRLRGPAKDATQ